MEEMGGWIHQPARELTSDFQGNANERYKPGEEIEGLGPVPRGTPNVPHFLGQDQQPIVGLWETQPSSGSNTTTESEATPLTWSVKVEAGI